MCNGSTAAPRMLFGTATFFFWAALYLYVPVLPVYAQSLGASLSMVGVVIAAYAIAQFTLRIPIGVWADAMGNRKLLVAGGVVMVTLGALGMGLASNPWLLFATRMITGIGAATWVAFTVLFASFYPMKQIGRAIGVISFINGSAMVAATGLGGVISQIGGYQAAFFGATLLGIASLASILPVREPDPPRPQAASWPSFVRVASDRMLLTVSFMSMLVSFANFSGVFGFIPVYAAGIGGTSFDLGIITMLSLGASAIAALGSVFLAERWGYPATIRIGAIFMSAALFITPFIQWVPLLCAVQVVNGAGRGLLTTTLMVLSIREVVPEQRATAMGVYQAVYSLGMLSGPLVSGFLANICGLPSVFYLSGLLCLLPAGLAHLTASSRGQQSDQ